MIYYVASLALGLNPVTQHCIIDSCKDGYSLSQSIDRHL